MVTNVTNVTSLSRSGLSDFLVQRVSAVILALYTLCVLGFFLTNADVTHAGLVDYFAHPIMKLFSILAVLALAAHAWIGMWTVGTDYIRPHYFGAHATSWRITYQIVCLTLIFAFVVWTVPLFWGL